MSDEREGLRALLAEHYRSNGWVVARSEDGTIRATGLGGVTWIGLPVVSADFTDATFEERLTKLGDERMADGKRCPLELFPATECEALLRELLRELRLDARGHIEVYATAA